MAKEKKVLSVDAYQTIVFASLAFGGIGHSTWFDHHGAPLCPHAMLMTGKSNAPRSNKELCDLGFDPGSCDEIVLEAIRRQRYGRSWMHHERITHTAFFKEAGIVSA